MMRLFSKLELVQNIKSKKKSFILVRKGKNHGSRIVGSKQNHLKCVIITTKKVNELIDQNSSIIGELSFIKSKLLNSLKKSFATKLLIPLRESKKVDPIPFF
jgi:hypothetical protein